MTTDDLPETPAESPVERAEHLVGVPDEFQRLWTPHRLVYVSDAHQPDERECPFCDAPKRDDQASLIVHRGVNAFVIMNLYPYNAGHMLVCPYRHVSMYDDATVDEVAEIAALTQTAMRVLRRVAHNDGANIGMNQGEVAGAGIAGHLHQHIVPRWAQDSNFFPIIARTRAVPRLIGEMRDELALAWPTDGHASTTNDVE